MFNVLKAWGKFVNNLGAACWNYVVVHPHSTSLNALTGRGGVNKSPVLPTKTPSFTHASPQRFSWNLPPLSIVFSPLSTEPITTTTNLKSKER
jgi:hypothetical protein